MALTSINCRSVLPEGARIPPSTRLYFQLTGMDTQTEGIVLPLPVWLDLNKETTVELEPNELGSRKTYYQVRMSSHVGDEPLGRIYVTETDDTLDLSELLNDQWTEIPTIGAARGWADIARQFAEDANVSLDDFREEAAEIIQTANTLVEEFRQEFEGSDLIVYVSETEKSVRLAMGDVAIVEETQDTVTINFPSVTIE